MNRRAAHLALVLPILGAAALGPAAPAACRLDKAPKFALGDRVTRIYVQSHQNTFIDKTGQTTRRTITVVDSKEIQSVTAVDQAGRVMQFRDHLVSARMQYKLAAAGQPVEAATTELSDVHCLAERAGRTFRADTTTIASSAIESLSAQGVALVKRFFNDRMDFHAYQETNTLLMPSGPVLVGSKWRPSPEALVRWLRKKPACRRMKITNPIGTFELVKIVEGTATVRGSVTFDLQIGKIPAQVKMRISCRIKADSGRWVSESITSHLTASDGELTFRADVIASGSMIYQAGSGQAPATMPAHRHNLGWPPAGEDTNSFRSAAHGVSLNIPEGYKRSKADKTAAKGRPIIFSASGGRTVSIALKEAKLPIDMDRLSPIVIGNLKQTIPRYTVIQKKRVALPGNVPAMLVIAHGRDNTITIVTLFAIDGRRLVSVSATAPGNRPQHVAEMKRIAETLRVFEPDLSATE